MKATVMVGIPGCGKTTAVAAHGDVVEVNRDNLRFELTGSFTNFEHEGLINRRHAARLRQAAAEGRDVVVSDTNAVRRYRRSLIKLLKCLGYEVEVVVFDVGPETCLARNETRSKPVLPEIIRRMAHRLRLNPPSLEEGMDRLRFIRQEGAAPLYLEAPAEIAGAVPGE
ncbi:MAG TPA: AAA family ATPase [Stenomitos sp.]